MTELQYVAGAFDPCICRESRSHNEAPYRWEFLCFYTIRVSQSGQVHNHPLDNLTWKKGISAWDCARWLSWLVCIVHLSLTSPSQIQPSVQIRFIYRHKPSLLSKEKDISISLSIALNLLNDSNRILGLVRIRFWPSFIFITILSLGTKPKNRPYASVGSLQHGTVIHLLLISLKAFEGDSGCFEMHLQNEHIPCFALVRIHFALNNAWRHPRE